MSDRTVTLRVDLTLPSLKLGLGPLSYDPLKQLLGIDPRDALRPLLCAEPYARTVAGANVEVFPLALAPGTRVSVPLGTYGEIAVGNDLGLLALTVPLTASLWLARQVGPLLVAGPTPVVDRDGARRVATAWLRLAPGARAALPLGPLGQLGLEAA
jgi:hypothetical protein